MSNPTKNNEHTASLREVEFYNCWRRMFQYIITHIFYMIRFKLVYRLEVFGKENIPKDNKYIIAANHLSTLDPPLIAAIMDRGVAYMAKKELFENPFMRWWLNWLGAFAVDREKFGIFVDAENNRLTITQEGLEALEAHYFKKLEATPLVRNNLFKHAYLTGKWSICYNALKLFNTIKKQDEIMEE